MMSRRSRRRNEKALSKGLCLLGAAIGMAMTVMGLLCLLVVATVGEELDSKPLVRALLKDTGSERDDSEYSGVGSLVSLGMLCSCVGLRSPTFR